MDDRTQLDFLHDFYSWLEAWSAPKKNGLSDLTFNAAKVTTITFVRLANSVLDEKTNNINYITFGAISQDFEEGRFGWFRQLCGGNYYNSVLQFLQAEKKIRIQSLVKMGFLISDIKVIFAGTDEPNKKLVEDLSREIIEKLSHFRFRENSVITKSDKTVVFYTAGAIVHGLKKKCKCPSCCEMITRNSEYISIEDGDIVDTEHHKLVDMVNRGGLNKPSDMVYITCIHAWNLYSSLQNNEQLFAQVMLSSNPRSVFTAVFLHLISDDEDTSELCKYKCTSGCSFLEIIKQITIATFNIKARNYVNEQNDKIHESRKRSTGDYKKSATARKIKKLTSS